VSIINAEFGTKKLGHKVMNIENDLAPKDFGNKRGKDHKIGHGMNLHDVIIPF
jgi:hypothetical protein